MRALLLLAPLLVACAAAAAQAAGGRNSTTFVPWDDILLDCSAKGQGNDTDDRIWVGDEGSKYAPPSNLAPAAPAFGQDLSVPQVPYLTAQVSASHFTYSFPLGCGRKFLKLHFYLANYSNRAATAGLFSVSVNHAQRPVASHGPQQLKPGTQQRNPARANARRRQDPQRRRHHVHGRIIFKVNADLYLRAVGRR